MKKKIMSTWYEKSIPVMEMPFVSIEKTQKKHRKNTEKIAEKNEVDIKSLAIIHLTNRETIPKSIPLSPLNRLFILVLYHETSPLF